MTFHVLTTPEEYVQALLDAELGSSGTNMLAASFISSIYFPEAAIRRFYESASTRTGAACDILLARRRTAHNQRHQVRRKEIYEAQAFKKLLVEGMAHAQDSQYRNRPSEIKAALQTMLEWIRCDALEVAITSEVLPFVFAIYPPTVVVIDIRTNYLYQAIQGFLLKDESFHIFTTEFERLWRHSANHESASVDSLIEASLRQWDSGEAVDFSRWPSMIATDRY